MAFPLAILGLIPNLFSYWQKKQEMQLRWFDLIFSIIKDLAAFTIAHIRIILIGLVLGYCLFNYIKAVNQAKTAIKQKDAAIKELDDKNNADIAAAKKRDAENRLNAILLQKKTTAEIEAHAAALKAIYLSKEKGLKNEIDISKRDVSNWRERVRLEVEKQTIQAAGVLDNDADRLAGRDNDATVFRSVQDIAAELEVCKEAGAIAAADYNLCKSYVDIQQSKLGVTRD
jgi:hypothetical protein